MTLVISADRVRTAGGIAGDAVACDAGTIVAVGELADLLQPGTEHHSYPGATIVPGVRDAHFHPVPYTAAISGVSLKTARDLADVAGRLRAGVPAEPERPLVALRLDDETLRERRLPDRHDLDAAVVDRPVITHRYCGHVAVANSAALSIAGIDAATPDPVGGVIDRDPDGVPTGVLRETAIEIVSHALAGSNSISRAAVLQALSGLAGLGITSIGAMVRLADGPWASLGNEVELLCSVAEELPINLHAYVIANSTDELFLAKSMIDDVGPRLRWAGVKRFSDGSLGGHTAAMHEPFSDAAGQVGTLRITSRDEELARACIALGGTVAIHAIGDLACSRVLDLFEQLTGEGTNPNRLRLEHASVLTVADIDRIGKLGIIVSAQPAFLASETEWLEARVGVERLTRTYPFRSLLDRGVTVAAGSDCPVEAPNPWPAMAVAQDRCGVAPQQSVTSAEAFAMFTDASAVALSESAPLAARSQADLVLVDRDPVAATPSELRHLEVIDTYLAGTRVEVDRTIATWND